MSVSFVAAGPFVTSVLYLAGRFPSQAVNRWLSSQTDPFICLFPQTDPFDQEQVARPLLKSAAALTMRAAGEDIFCGLRYESGR